MNIENLKFAALLHDIGKFYQRTDKKHDSIFNKFSQDDYGLNGAHGKWSADFVNNRWNDDIKDLVLYHHKHTSSNFPELCNMITKADHHSAAERIRSKEKQEVLEEPLISIFSRISIGNNDSINNQFVPLKELTLNDDSFELLKPSEHKPMSGWNLRPDYNILWERFLAELSMVNNINDFDTILALMKKYTSTIPSAVYVSESDISLYDHSKTTAALAICRYLFNKDSNEKLTQNDNQDVYLTINGDISGIQNFIYNVSSPQDAQSGMSKRLRGRSLYLTLITDAIASKIIKDLKLSKANILFCGGGRFTIIAPNTEIAKKALNLIVNKVNKVFIDKFNAELFLAIATEESCGDDFKNFGKVLGTLSNKLIEDKKHKFVDNLEDVFKLEESVDYEKTCIVCGNKTNNDICDECKAHEELGQKVANSWFMIKYYSKTALNKFYFESLEIGYIFERNSAGLVDRINDLASKTDKLEIIKLNNTDFLELSKEVSHENVSFSFSFIANIVPRYSRNIPLYFEHLAEISKGANKLGVLKMDVDNLGLIFSEGFKNLEEGSNSDKGSSISRISTLSSSMEMFFSGFINKIAENYKIYRNNKGFEDKLDPITLNLQDNEDTITVYKPKLGESCSNSKEEIPTIHINYSGGDDLLVLGPYDDIIKFAQEVNNKFNQWTCNNPSINLSAGINIVGSKFPIGKASLIAEDFLIASKDCGRNKITLFNETVNWNNYKDSFKGFNELLDFGEDLENNVNSGNISKGIVYSMLRLWEDSFLSESGILKDEKEWEKRQLNRIKTKKFVPLFKYKLRLIKDKNIRDDFDKTGLKIMPWAKIPVSWVSLRMR